MTAALALSHVFHSFGPRVALDDFSLTTEAGQVVAMIGFNGAGKTTAMRVLAGRLRPTDGTTGVLGETPGHLAHGVARKFGHLIDGPLAHPDLTITENVRTAARLHGMHRAAAAAATLAVIGRLALDPWADVRAKDLSQGNLQRLGIACAVVHSPQVVILDEPTGALDPRGVVVVRDLIRGLSGHGAAVLVSSHHLDEVSRIADRIVVVHAGRVIGDLEPGGADLERRFFAMVHAADVAGHDRKGAAA